MKKIIFILLALNLSSVFAYVHTGKIVSIKIRANGVIKVELDTAWENTSCRTKDWWVIKDENSTAGKAQLSLILTAQVSGKTVEIDGFPGLGSCIRMVNGGTKIGEDIKNVSILNE